MSRRAGPLPHLYGFGIVDRLGEPYWSDDCVCESHRPLEDLVNDLNDDDPQDEDEFAGRRPFRVVRLVWVGSGKVGS